LCHLFSAVLIFVNTCAHTCYLLLEVNFNFQLVSKLGTLCVDLIRECYFC
jgi:hypothetical protein